MFFEVLPPILNFVGAILLGSGYLVSTKKAVEDNVSRYAYDTDEENKKLPAIRNVLKQRQLTIAGLVILSLGLILEIVKLFL